MVPLDVVVRVPLAAGAVVELDEADAALHQAARQQAVAAERGGLLVVHAVEPPGFLGLAGQVHGLGRRGLHPEGELVAPDPGVELVLMGPRAGMVAVELLRGSSSLPRCRAPSLPSGGSRSRIGAPAAERRVPW